MHLINKLIFLIVISLPLTVWGANVHYILDITVEPKSKTLIGVASLKAG